MHFLCFLSSYICSTFEHVWVLELLMLFQASQSSYLCMSKTQTLMYFYCFSALSSSPDSSRGVKIFASLHKRSKELCSIQMNSLFLVTATCWEERDVCTVTSFSYLPLWEN